MTRLVDVPMSVHVPPSTVAWDMGSRSFLGLMPHLFGFVWMGEHGRAGGRGGVVSAWRLVSACR
jgi:hypothetical protein